MDQFFTWSFLATFAGCATATAVITQFIKNLKPFKNVATQWVAYGIALVLLFAATYFTDGLTGPVTALIPFNAILIALAANGAYSAITRVTRVNQATTEFKTEAEARAAFPDINNETLESIDENIKIIKKMISTAASTAEAEKYETALSYAETLRAAKVATGGAVASGTTGAV